LGAPPNEKETLPARCVQNAKRNRTTELRVRALYATGVNVVAPA